MDWGRAKTVLITAFLLLNILLGQQLWMDELKLSTFSENAEKRQEMERLLELKRIQVTAAIPEETPVLSEMTVRLEARAEEPVPLREPFPLSVLEDPAAVKERLRPDIPQIEGYEADAYAFKSDQSVYVMNQSIQGLPMFEMRLELIASQGQVSAYRLLAADLELSSPDEAQVKEQETVLSAYTVLGSLAESYFPQGAVVADVRLGYHGPIFESDTQVLAPYWRITLDAGDIYFVHAISGAVEGPSVWENQETITE